MEDQAAREFVQAAEMLKLVQDNPFSERAQEISRLIARRTYELFESGGSLRSLSGEYAAVGVKRNPGRQCPGSHVPVVRLHPTGCGDARLELDARLCVWQQAGCDLHGNKTDGQCHSAHTCSGLGS